MTDTDKKIILLINTLQSRLHRFHWAKDDKSYISIGSSADTFRIRIGFDLTLRITTVFDEDLVPIEDLNTVYSVEARGALARSVSNAWKDRADLLDRVVKELKNV